MCKFIASEILLINWENNETIIAIKKAEQIKQDRIKEVKKRIKQKEELTQDDLELIRQAIDVQIWWKDITAKLKD